MRKYDYKRLDHSIFRSGMIITATDNFPYALIFKDCKLMNYLFLGYSVSDYADINNLIYVSKKEASNRGLSVPRNICVDEENVIDISRTLLRRALYFKE